MSMRTRRASSRATANRLSDDEFDPSSGDEEDELAVLRGEDADEKYDLQLSREGKNVGKSLRRLPVFEDDGEVVDKDGVYESFGQLPLGEREKVDAKRLRLADLEMGSEDEMYSMEEDEDDAETEDAPIVIKPTIATNPSHVRNQRKTEADILGVRIRLQSLVSLLSKLDTKRRVSDKEGLGFMKQIVSNLADMRNSMFENGSINKTPLSISSDDDTDDIWDQISSSESELWNYHRAVIEAWERRTHLATTRGKELRAMNKSIFEQTEAAMARRQEIGKSASFNEEDSDFYQQMLRDFVQTRSNDSAAVSKDKSKQKRQEYLARQARREPTLNYDVHEKLIDFLPPVTLPAPTVDVDQLVKSLFRS